MAALLAATRLPNGTRSTRRCLHAPFFANSRLADPPSSPGVKPEHRSKNDAEGGDSSSSSSAQTESGVEPFLAEMFGLFRQVRDLHAVRERLAERGVPIEEEPKVKPWGPSRWSRAIPTASPRSSSRDAARAPAQTTPVTRAISRGPNWPSVGSAQQNQGSVSRGLASTEPHGTGSGLRAGPSARPAAS